VNDTAAKLHERLLVLRCQSGDQSALGELIARFTPGLRLYLRKLTDDMATADDLIQETWIDVYRKVVGLKSLDAFVGWLYRIARDKAYRELRRRRAVELAARDGLPDVVAGGEVDDAFTPEDAERVQVVIGSLPRDQREVLLLRFVEDMSYEQIAGVVGCPVGTVRSRIHYAKQAMRQRLQ
jgi:RNA polymerase sigma-70 factor (ECF subfamily)